MNIQGGGLSFDISGTNRELLRVLEESKRAIQQFSTSAVQNGKGIDKTFEATAAVINSGFATIDRIFEENKTALKDLQAQYEELGQKAGKAFTEGRDEEYRAMAAQQATLKSEINLRQQAISEAEKQADALMKEEQELNKQREAAERSARAQQSLEVQLRRCREALVAMEAEGKRGTAEFREMQEEAARLAKAWKDATDQSNILAHDQRGMQGLISGLSGLSGGFAAAQGAASLFIGENENLQKVMLKVQSLMSITIGLQQVEQMLNKDSAFRLVTVAKAKDLLTAANVRLAAALHISNTAAAALMATLTLGLSVAITAVIVALARMQSKQAEAKKQAEEFNNKVAEAAAEPVTAYRMLQAEWLSLTGSLKEREKWVQDNADKFEDLGYSVRSAQEAEELLVTNSAKFVEAMMLRAKATATSELAVEKYKKVIEAQNRLDTTPKAYVSKKGTYTDGYGVQRKGVVLEKSSNWKEAEEELQKAEEAYDRLVNQQIKFTQQEKEILASIGNQTGKVVAGSVEAAEKELSRLQELYKKAATDTERADIAKQIAEQQKELNRISYNSGGNKSGGKEDADPFAEQLNERKALYSKYLKWVTSSDETVRKAANTEFAALLQEGTSYLDYLENLRNEISSKANKTATDLKNIATLNNEIANATKEAVISDFDAQLQRELSMCQTVSEQLALIERRREELSGDNSDVDNAKSDILDVAEEDTKAKARQETRELLQEYASYVQEKLEFEESYARKRELLSKAAAEASNEQEKKTAEAALAALEKQRKEYESRSGSEQYDQLLTEYQSYQEKQTAILRKYAEQRAEAEKQGNLSMITQINAKEQEELSKLAASRLMATESWNQLFSDLSRLSTRTINKLLEDINNKKITFSTQFNPADLKAINDQLEKARNELESRNPFLALKNSLAELRAAMNAESLLDSDDPFVKSLQEKKQQYEQYAEAVSSTDEILAGAAKTAYADLLKEGSSYIDMLRRKIAELENIKLTVGLEVEGEEQLAVLKAALNKETGETKSVGEAFKSTFSDIGSSVNFVSGAFDSVVSGIKNMGISMSEETQAILGDISGIMQGAGQLATGIATGNPLGIIQGSIGLLSSAFDLFNFRDRKAEKSIKRHQEAVTKLGYAYNALEHAVDNALGETVYQNQTAMIENLRQQQNEINGMIRDEESKKDTDWGRIDEWKEQYAEIGRQIEDIIAEITQSITQTSAPELADQLADALVEAFENGESAAESFGEVANDVIKNAVKNALALQFLEEPLQRAIKQLQKDMGFDEEGNGTFDGLTEAEQARFKAAIQAAGRNFEQAMNMYKDLFEQIEDEGDPTTLSGAYATASQESIDLLAGQTNAVRQNQVTSIALIREQLTYLASMDRGISVIAERLLRIINRLSTPTDDGLRSQGITDY
nr:MAG: hypothetical protein [Bacteriophage sp.]